MLFGYYSLFNNWVRKKNLSNFNYSRKSFNSINSWLKDLKNNSSPDVKIFLVGNKTDLEKERKVSTEKGQK